MDATRISTNSIGVDLSDFFSVSTDFILGLDDRRYIEITGLTDCQLAHIAAIIDDIRGKQCG